MENKLVKFVCSYSDRNFILTDLTKVLRECHPKNNKFIRLAKKLRYARISARQMLSSSILLRVYGERSVFLGFLNLISIQSWFSPAFFVHICMNVRR
ncbi:MAG: hypothetical protein GW903_08880 [Alphaproteobacteria bacterium]|nr:hypothetical protein [Alphaproteobacteria bacterium]NCQ88922.1 hypothetical protein [Alphaproteobacteria bacterium]